jgi:type I restriction enzyme R subunit
VYNFSQSVEDGATVPIFYENRVPRLENTNVDLQNDIGRIMEKYEMSEDMEEKLENEFSTAYEILTRDDRLEKVAEDIVSHYMGRGNSGKAMVVCIDKKTTVKMYLKVQKHFKAYRSRLEARLVQSSLDTEKQGIMKEIEALDALDTAVIISLGNNQNEIDTFRKIGIDFRPIRKRLLEEDLETKFKNPENGLRIAFVCNMWLTGFDVPSITTLYLDKPIKNHALMQTIARTNRVF